MTKEDLGLGEIWHNTGLKSEEWQFFVTQNWLKNCFYKPIVAQHRCGSKKFANLKTAISSRLWSCLQFV